MKKSLLVVFVLLCAAHLKAQKLELTVQAAAGPFHYSGPSTSADVVSFEAKGMNNAFASNSTNNNYGVSYSFAAQVQTVTKKGFIAGLQGGYDLSISKVYIYPVVYYFNIQQGPSAPAVSGNLNLRNEFIDVNPYVGYRFSSKDFNLDILPGAEIAANTSSYTKGSATSDDGTTSTSNDKRSDLATDFRLKLAIAGYFGRYGLTASYAYGLTDYKKYDSETYEPYSARTRLFRFGVSYRIF